MNSKLRICGLAAALLAMPAPTVAAEPATQARGGAAKGETAQTAPLGEARYDLASSKPQTVRDRSTRSPHAGKVAARHSLSATRVSYAAAPAAAIEGPSLNYRPARRGPVLELGALGGGGMADAPFLAHLGVDWRF